MPMNPSGASQPGVIYLAIMALLTSISALATDIMLPALGVIGRDLGSATSTTQHLWSPPSFSGWRLASLLSVRWPMPMAASRW